MSMNDFLPMLRSFEAMGGNWVFPEDKEVMRQMFLDLRPDEQATMAARMLRCHGVMADVYMDLAVDGYGLMDYGCFLHLSGFSYKPSLFFNFKEWVKLGNITRTGPFIFEQLISNEIEGIKRMVPAAGERLRKGIAVSPIIVSITSPTGPFVSAKVGGAHDLLGFSFFEAEMDDASGQEFLDEYRNCLSMVQTTDGHALTYSKRDDKGGAALGYIDKISGGGVLDKLVRGGLANIAISRALNEYAKWDRIGGRLADKYIK